SAVEVLKEAVRRTGFKRKRAKLAGSGRGIGLSLFYHGAGFTGSGEVMLGSRAGLETTPSGVRILVANTEIGQGTRTMLAPIVAEGLRSEEHTSELQSLTNLVCRLLLEKKNT